MGLQKPYRRGSLFGFHYTFAKRGDGIAMHEHTETHRHSIFVLHGSVLVYGQEGPEGWHRELYVGDGYSVPAYVQHEIQALEDDTVILNLNQHGMPPEYAGLAESEFHGETKPPLFCLDRIAS